MNFLDSFKGYKTYFVAAIMVILVGLKGTGYLDQPTFDSVMTILTALGLAALRAGVKNSIRGTDGSMDFIDQPAALLPSEPTPISPVQPAQPTQIPASGSITLTPDQIQHLQNGNSLTITQTAASQNAAPLQNPAVQ